MSFMVVLRHDEPGLGADGGRGQSGDLLGRPGEQAEAISEVVKPISIYRQYFLPLLIFRYGDFYDKM